MAGKETRHPQKPRPSKTRLLLSLSTEISIRESGDAAVTKCIEDRMHEVCGCCTYMPKWHKQIEQATASSYGRREGGGTEHKTCIHACTCIVYATHLLTKTSDASENQKSVKHHRHRTEKVVEGSGASCTSIAGKQKWATNCTNFKKWREKDGNQN